MRATKGAAESTSGKMTPRTPTVVPAMALVMGMTETIRMMNGMERAMLTIHPSTEYSARMGLRLPGALT